jgi:hypothetical protein
MIDWYKPTSPFVTDPQWHADLAEQIEWESRRVLKDLPEREKRKGRPRKPPEGFSEREA